MPNKDVRTIAGSKKGKHSTAGRRRVVYRDTKGQSKEALVVDQGSVSGLKLKMTSNNNAVIDNVPACTSVNGTACYDAKY